MLINVPRGFRGCDPVCVSHEPGAVAQAVDQPKVTAGAWRRFLFCNAPRIFLGSLFSLEMWYHGRGVVCIARPMPHACSLVIQQTRLYLLPNGLGFPKRYIFWRCSFLSAAWVMLYNT